MCVPCGSRFNTWNRGGLNDTDMRIANGAPINVDRAPWQVALYRTDLRTIFCGGSLINPR